MAARVFDGSRTYFASERSKRQQHIAELKALGEEDKLRDLLLSKSRLRDNLATLGSFRDNGDDGRYGR